MGKQVQEIIPLILGAATAHDDVELKEGVLLTLEALVLKCPTESGPFIPQIVEAGASLIKYDPNWAADDEDEEDVEMDDDDEDDEDDFGDDDLDEDDVSTNRSAELLLFPVADLLSSIVAGRCLVQSSPCCHQATRILHRHPVRPPRSFLQVNRPDTPLEVWRA